MLWPIDPWREIDRMRREMDDLLKRSNLPFVGMQFPLVNVYDNKDELVVVAELPGVRREDVSISMHDNTLTITGRRVIKEYGRDAKIIRQEQPEGPFEKKIKLQVKIKEPGIKAKFQDGILKVILPKAEEARAKQITIEGE